jgi:hypothetical protein
MALRSARRIEQNMDRLTRPRLGSKSVYELRRSNLVALHDEIAADAPEMARQALAQLQHVLRWHSLRDDAFAPPTAPGLTRATKGQPRDCVLSDEEIRDVWRGLDVIAGESPVFAAYAPLVRALLLMARRRDELGGAHWREVIADILMIPGARMKALRKREGRPAMEPWRLHDARRTGRSLMSRLRIPADPCERVLDHALPTIRKTYDLHDYIDEKRAALEALAALVDRIVDPNGGTVAPFAKAQKTGSKKAAVFSSKKETRKKRVFFYAIFHTNLCNFSRESSCESLCNFSCTFSCKDWHFLSAFFLARFFASKVAVYLAYEMTGDCNFSIAFLSKDRDFWGSGHRGCILGWAEAVFNLTAAPTPIDKFFRVFCSIVFIFAVETQNASQSQDQGRRARLALFGDRGGRAVHMLCAADHGSLERNRRRTAVLQGRRQNSVSH